MRFQRLLAFVVTASFASQVNAKPAWEISPRWLCRSNSMVICREPGICERQVPTAIEEIDFDEGTIRGFDASDEEVEHIAAKQFLASKYGPGITYFSIAGGQSYAIIDRPKDSILDDGKSYPLQTTTIYGESQAIHYGECRARPAR